MIYAQPVVDGSRRHRYSGGSSVVPYRRNQPPVQASSAITAAPAKSSPQKVGQYNPDGFPDIQRQLAPSLASALRPAGASRWMLPSVAAITPQYIEATLRGALAGNHVQAWELFDLMIDTDPEIAACINEYVSGVLEKKMVVTPYTQGNNEPTPSAIKKAGIVEACLRNMRPDMANDENDFGSMVRDILFARFHGQSVLEIDWYTKDGSGLNIKNFDELGDVIVPRSTYWVHPVCYAWDMNGRLGLRMAVESHLKNAIAQNRNIGRDVVKNLVQNIGTDRVKSMVEPPAWNWITSQARPSQLMDFPANKFLIGIDKFKAGTIMGSGSELRPLAFWWIASMFCGDWLLNYAQLFGIPFRKATCAPSTSEPKKAEIRQLLESMGAAGYILLDAGNTVEFERAMGGAGDSPQAFLFRFANEMKRKVILRQTMSGGAGSAGTGVGKGGMDTEAMGPKDQCVNDGARYVGSVLSLQFAPWILNVNFGEDGDTECPTISLVDEEVGSYQDAQKVQIVSNFMDVGEDWARQYFKVPPPASGEKILGKDTGSAVLKQQQGGGFGDGSDSGYGYSDDEQQQGESSDDFNARCARNRSQRALKAARAAGRKSIVARSTQKLLPAPATVVRAASETVQPLVSRLKAIDAIEDVEMKKAAMTKFLKDLPKVTNAIKHDPSLAEAVAEAIK
jgi:phage gp29-like protein